MLVVERSNASIYNYQGRLVASPRWPNMRLEHLRNNHISLASDSLAIRDSTDLKSMQVKLIKFLLHYYLNITAVHVLDLTSNRNASDTTSTIQHTLQIIQIALNQTGPPAQRNLCILDRNKDLYIATIRSSNKMMLKLGN